MNPRVPAVLRVIGRSIVDWWDGWLDMVMVVAVWFFAQLTVVLGPPATFGVYYVVHGMVNGQASGVRGMFEGARKYFKKALVWGVINFLAVFLLSFSMYFYANVEAVWALSLFILVMMMAVLWVATQFYAIPYFFEQDYKSVKVAMRNGVLTALASPFYTLILMILVLVVVLLSFGFVIPIFLGLPGLIPFLGFRALDDRLIAFGLRKPEKTPKEIEMEESSKIEVPNLEGIAPDERPGPRR